MSEILDGLGEFIGEIGKYVALWFVAGGIATLISIGVIVLTGGFAETVTELTMIAVVDVFPFPLNMFVSSQINPVGFALELILQMLIFVGLLYLGNTGGRN